MDWIEQRQVLQSIHQSLSNAKNTTLSRIQQQNDVNDEPFKSAAGENDINNDDFIDTNNNNNNGNSLSIDVDNFCSTMKDSNKSRIGGWLLRKESQVTESSNSDEVKNGINNDDEEKEDEGETDDNQENKEDKDVIFVGQMDSIDGTIRRCQTAAAAAAAEGEDRNLLLDDKKEHYLMLNDLGGGGVGGGDKNCYVDGSPETFFLPHAPQQDIGDSETLRRESVRSLLNQQQQSSSSSSSSSIVLVVPSIDHHCRPHTHPHNHRHPPTSFLSPIKDHLSSRRAKTDKVRLEDGEKGKCFLSSCYYHCYSRRRANTDQGGRRRLNLCTKSVRRIGFVSLVICLLLALLTAAFIWFT